MYSLFSKMVDAWEKEKRRGGTGQDEQKFKNQSLLGGGPQKEEAIRISGPQRRGL